MLRQGQYKPLPVEQQVVQIYAATPRADGKPSWLRNYPLDDVTRYMEEMSEFMRERHPEILTEIRTTGALGDAVRSKLDEALDAFAKIFQASSASV
jgi:F-type H+-transporting ATPase subunit alpha